MYLMLSVHILSVHVWAVMIKSNIYLSCQKFAVVVDIDLYEMTESQKHWKRDSETNRQTDRQTYRGRKGRLGYVAFLY